MDKENVREPRTPAPALEGEAGVRDAGGERADGFTPEWLVVHCLGFGACWGWVHVAFFSGVLWGSASELLGIQAWMANVFANGAAMIVFGAVALRMSPLGGSRPFVLAMLCLVVLGTAGLAASGAGFDGAVVMAGAVASGVGSAGILLLWAEAYTAIPSDYAKKYAIPGSMVAGVAFFLVVNMLPFAVALAATMLLPVLSIGLLRWSSRAVSGPAPARPAADRRAGAPRRAGEGGRPALRELAQAVPIRFVLILAIYCLAPGFMRGNTAVLSFTSSGVGLQVFAGAAVVMVAVSVASIVLVRDSKINLAYKLIVPLMAAGLFLLPLLSVGRESLAGAAIMSGYILLETYVWAALSDRAARAKAPAATVFGVGKTGMNIGLAAGTFFGVYFGSSSSTLLVGASLFIVYLFIVLENVPSSKGGVSLLIEVPQAEATGAARLKSLTEEEAGRMDLADAFDALMDEKCRIAAERFDLSAREAEVLGLLARGRSLRSAGEELGVAYSTVKTHTDHIYAKTGVHARADLAKLIEQI